MPDITMCINKNCPLRAKCYRYRAVSSTWQSFANYQFYTIAKLSDPAIYETKCDYFWEIDGRILQSVEEADNRYIPTQNNQKEE